MDRESLYKMLFVLAFIAIMIIRLYYQSKILREKREIKVREDIIGLISGIIAALTTIIFGVEYIFFQGAFSFAYILRYPDLIRLFGGILLVVGISLLGISHHHLGKSFHSLMVLKENHELIETGPYRFIRHPIYSAFLLSYFGGGLISSNWILTFVPMITYAIMVTIRMGKEEKILEEEFGQRYIDYEKRTGILFFKIRGRG
jgi:protein-S-isoprenylcysteine O-methyltransferase Ste14